MPLFDVARGQQKGRRTAGLFGNTRAFYFFVLLDDEELVSLLGLVELELLLVSLLDELELAPLVPPEVEPDIPPDVPDWLELLAGGVEEVSLELEDDDDGGVLGVVALDDEDEDGEVLGVVVDDEDDDVGGVLGVVVDDEEDEDGGVTTVVFGGDRSQAASAIAPATATSNALFMASPWRIESIGNYRSGARWVECAAR